MKRKLTLGKDVIAQLSNDEMNNLNGGDSSRRTLDPGSLACSYVDPGCQYTDSRGCKLGSQGEYICVIDEHAFRPIVY